jgi:hypothetical protein
MTAIPNTVSLTNIADGSNIVAADHRNNYAAIQTAVNGLIAALSGGSAGQVLEALSSSSVDWNGGVYQAYVPTWTASGTAPAIGDAAVTARFARLGKFVHAYGRITFGAGSTFGTGNWSFALPVAASASAITAQLSGPVFLYDSSANAMGLAFVSITGALVMTTEYPATWLGTFTQAGQLTPWTWAAGDILEWNILYEAA